MTDWTAGYVADIGYTYGVYGELNPLRTRLALLDKGIAPPDIKNACELGFGQGVSVNMHAASGAADWHATDFNPSQAGFARELGDISGAALTDEAFAEFCTRDDLPDFDFIGLHGIWTWISDENRAVIVDFVRRKLRIGGVLYISYNTLPGWAAAAPLRHLMTRHSEVMSAPGQLITERIGSALEFTENLLATNPGYVRTNPSVKERFDKVKGQNRNYLAHEYFNRDWEPMYFADMADWLAPAKLSYAGSAHLLDHVDAINLTADQQKVMKDIPDLQFAESVRDYLINQQFRRDYWVRGPRKLSPLLHAEALRALRLVLTAHRPDVALTVNGALGEANLTESVYKPILDLMADHMARSIGEIVDAVQGQGLVFAQVLQALVILTGAGHLAPAQDPAEIGAARKRSKALNARILDLARGSSDIAYLASPVTGGGISVPRFQQLFLLAQSKGRKSPAEMAEFAWQILKSQGQKIVKDGAALESDDANLAELRSQSEEFAEKRMPIMKALEIA